MSENTIVSFRDPAGRDALTELIQAKARQMIAEAVQGELEAFLAQHANRRDDQGHRTVVRNGYQPEREVLTGVGPVTVKMPKTRDRAGRIPGFRSTLIPPYLKKTKRVEDVIPWLYLCGVSTNDFDQALSALFGESVKGLSPNTISRLKESWQDEYEVWRTKDWSGRRFVYVWADGIYARVRAGERQCILVVIGCDDQGKKHFLAIESGQRESEMSWHEVLLKLKDRGLKVAPELAIADGALGFWSALDKVFPTTRHQRCWVHKTANVLNKLPKGLHPAAKASLHDIYFAADRKSATKAMDRFIETYQDKYPKAAECLEKDRDSLLAFYDFPAANWQHIRTSNPIESTFATIRLRTVKTRNCVSEKSGLMLLYRLAITAETGWRRLRGFKHLTNLINGVKFVDGIDEREVSREAA